MNSQYENLEVNIVKIFEELYYWSLYNIYGIRLSKGISNNLEDTVKIIDKKIQELKISQGKEEDNKIKICI